MAAIGRYDQLSSPQRTSPGRPVRRLGREGTRGNGTHGRRDGHSGRQTGPKPAETKPESRTDPSFRRQSKQAEHPTNRHTHTHTQGQADPPPCVTAWRNPPASRPPRTCPGVGTGRPGSADRPPPVIISAAGGQQAATGVNRRRQAATGADPPPLRDYARLGVVRAAVCVPPAGARVPACQMLSTVLHGFYQSGRRYQISETATAISATLGDWNRYRSY